jgi:hypothetical protein
MGIKQLMRLIQEKAPGAVRETELKNLFGRKVRGGWRSMCSWMFCATATCGLRIVFGRTWGACNDLCVAVGMLDPLHWTACTTSEPRHQSQEHALPARQTTIPPSTL